MPCACPSTDPRSRAGRPTSSRLFLARLLFLVAHGFFFTPTQQLWSQSTSAPSLRFVDATTSSGINFVHYSGRSGRHLIYETISCGLVTFDYDGDGLVDVYLPNGSAMEPSASGQSMGNRLYRNLGSMRFRDVTVEAGAGDDGFALGATSGDYDNDGDPDLLIANFGPSTLLENNGDGTFHRRLLDTGVTPLGTARMSAGPAMLDYDGDGSLDLFIANYIQYDPNRGVQRLIFGIPAAPGPKDYLPDSDLLYRNDGAGGFTDVSSASGIASFPAAGMGVLAWDFDGDGDCDIFVCNDSAPNHLYENIGDGRFEEIALIAGVAYDVTGAQQASMGVDVGDVGNDGLLDLVTTNFSDETPTLYQYLGDGYFDDIGPAVGLGAAHRRVTWGVVLADFDSDSYLDLFVGAGHLFDIVSNSNSAEQFAVPNILFQYRHGKFVDVSDQVAAVRDIQQVTRGVAVEDFDTDGDLDLLCLNFDGPIQLLENVTPQQRPTVGLRLVGKSSPRDGVGAQVICQPADRPDTVRRSVVVSGRGYQSDFGRSLHLSCPIGSRIEVFWPSGSMDTFQLNATDAELTLVEGEAAPVVLLHKETMP